MRWCERFWGEDAVFAQQYLVALSIGLSAIKLYWHMHQHMKNITLASSNKAIVMGLIFFIHEHMSTMIQNLEREHKKALRAQYVLVYGMQTANPFFRSSFGQNVLVSKSSSYAGTHKKCH